MSEENEIAEPPVVLISTPTGNILLADATEVPETRLFRDAWRLEGSVVTIDAEAAGVIAHRTRSRWRDWKEQQFFSWSGHLWDSDRDSASRIQGALAMAELAEEASPGSFTVEWNDAASGSMTLNYAGIKGLFLALATHTAAAHAASQLKRVAIDAAVAASDIAQLELIVAEMDSDLTPAED